MAQNAKAILSDTIVDILADSLNARVAGELDKFAEKAQPQINNMMKSCGTKIQAISNEFATALTKIINGNYLIQVVI